MIKVAMCHLNGKIIMFEISMFNQEITISFHLDLKNEQRLAHELKMAFLKHCISSIIALFIEEKNIPPDLVGAALQFELLIKKIDFVKGDDASIANWLDFHIHQFIKREQSYVNWCKSVPTHKKLSFLLGNLKARLFSEEKTTFISIDKIIRNAKEKLRHQLEQEINQKEKAQVIAAINHAWTNYQQSLWWPMGVIRLQQKNNMLASLQQAPDIYAALQILRAHIYEIEGQHVGMSFLANLAFYQRESRLAKALKNVLAEIKLPVADKTAEFSILKQINQALDDYLTDDWFYHNRGRRRLAYQLLAQLQTDNLNDNTDDVEKAYRMRSTLDHYIHAIDEEFYHTHFFSKYYTKKRSRLALRLEATKSHLIAAGKLPTLELGQDIKKPILDFIKSMLVTYQNESDICNALTILLRTIDEAKTPHAIEAIIEGHLRTTYTYDFATWVKNLFGQNSHCMMIAHLESALLNWQAAGILPAASDYKSFLQTLAENRQQHENELQRLESSLNIKIPRNIEAMREKGQHLQQQANVLLKKLTG